MSEHSELGQRAEESGGALRLLVGVLMANPLGKFCLFDLKDTQDGLILSPFKMQDIKNERNELNNRF